MTKLQEEMIDELWQESSQPAGTNRKAVTDARATWDSELGDIVLDAVTEEGQRIALRLLNPKLLAVTLQTALTAQANRLAEPGDAASA